MDNPSNPVQPEDKPLAAETASESALRSSSSPDPTTGRQPPSPHGFGGASWPAPGQGFSATRRLPTQLSSSVAASESKESSPNENVKSLAPDGFPYKTDDSTPSPPRATAPSMGLKPSLYPLTNPRDNTSSPPTPRATAPPQGVIMQPSFYPLSDTRPPNTSTPPIAAAQPSVQPSFYPSVAATDNNPSPPTASNVYHSAQPESPYSRYQRQQQLPPQRPLDQHQPFRELRVEDALIYLDDVKREFKQQPAIYNEFLSIMKNFKTQEVDTPGVIERVSKLFRGYNKLILGFNTFLPEGYKISLEDLQKKEAEEQALEAAEAASKTNEAPPSAPGPPAAKPAPVRKMAALPTVQAKAKSPPKPMKTAQVAAPARSSPTQLKAKSPVAQQPAQPQQHQAVEFDHAISYVTKIKRRFANDPSIYHQFLQILHNYQREQRGIKEVLEQVAHLFQDHPDLLKEFTFFLPDAVQEQAKERLHRAAAESEHRKRQAEEIQEREIQRKSNSTDPSPRLIDMTRAQQEEASRKRSLEDPESHVYNSAVERQFFDATKEALTAYTRDGGQAWAEFLKCLDMYAQDILSRQEMLNFVEPLLGKRHTKLFEEFKRILASAGQPRPTEESWYSVPLAEIDFSRCRRCSPSYRALPRDYPSHPCSDRSPEEAKVLNDVWVSLPVGSEESYTFRHMRRNTYEETLFRVEDERFEIDMVLDSNAATLQRLLPIAEEIAILAKEDTLPLDIMASSSDAAGLGAKRYQYCFDSKTLGVIHRNTISRIYGDSGAEMLELMVKNPTVAIPLVVQRLQQKDREWRAVRERLNRHWKELAELNYYKSLDHRGLTWRNIDKRATSTRIMISEIKDRAANGGAEGSEALKQKLEKAKEEHGTFYEVTMGNTIANNPDLTFLPKPDRRIFTPHMSLLYENNSWVQRDAFRILAFALERGSTSPADKERCHRLWVEFLGPWFGLSLNWMQQPAVAYQESTAASQTKVSIASSAPLVSEDDESMINNAEATETSAVDNVNGDDVDTDHHSLPPDTIVSTIYGDGTILEFRQAERIYVVQLLSCGAKGYLRPTSILCSLLPVEKSGYTQKLRESDRTRLARPGDQLAFGTQSLYLFFRLHLILVQRLNTAKRLAYSVDNDSSLITLIEQVPTGNSKATGRSRYEAYLSLLYASLDGGVGTSAEGGKYEDRVRSLLGHGAYELATLDKLISYIWKNLQSLAGDETMWNLIQLYRRHQETGTFHPEAFRQEAAFLSDGEVMYAFQHCPLSGKDESVLYVELVGVMDEEDESMEEFDEAPVEPNQKRQKR
ncbi:paired amphipathic helix protein Sin3a [Fistulifera solaris]|uniref:Paired amphipathic helix protein Sin3a n=1 Tax=Fistulifera solaris TaxID=1519565 RepID=A0A1Z5J881_FISSO|nr:paired amphipathic helix protein Sin3a [Fistulifera solaris]|eukprot:GAX10018.1 paired amphipathic helix protein Sin3a [Fistulifera solaris]